MSKGKEENLHPPVRPLRDCARKIPGILDQDLPPFVIARDNEPVGPIQQHDSVIFFNFRGDRAIEISQAFEKDDFDKFDRGPKT